MGRIRNWLRDSRDRVKVLHLFDLHGTNSFVQKST
jgi:hypothetical protein